MKPRTSTTATTALSLFIIMARSTPSVRAATLTETSPVAATGPAAKTLAARSVLDTTESGTPADATFRASTAANAPPDNTTPRWASRFASIALAARQPSGHGPFRTSEQAGDLLPGSPLQIAQHDDGSVDVRQAAQLLVQ